MFSIILLGIILVVVVAFIIGIVVVASKNSPKGDGDMIRKVYVYLVLFATLMMTIGGGVSVFMNLADLIAPESYYQTFEEYKMYSQKEYTTSEEGEKVEIVKSDEELRATYDRLVDDWQTKEINRAKNSIIKSLGWIIIPLPIFIYFQRKLNKEEK